MSLPIKDGTGTATALSTNEVGGVHTPRHVVDSVSSTVTVTSSVASPVYVSGSVNIGQPISVNVDLSDEMTVVVSSSAGNPVYTTGSVNVTLNDIVSGLRTGVSDGKSALLVSLSGSSGSFNKVQLFESTVEINNIGADLAFNALTSSFDQSGGYGKINVQVTGSSVTQIENSGVPIETVLYGTSSVKITGSNVITEGPYDIILVRGTGSQTEITNNGFTEAIDALTASFAANKFRVELTGNSITQISNGPSPIEIVSYQTSSVKITGSNIITIGNYDAVVSKLTQSYITIDNPDFQQALGSITSSWDYSGGYGKFNVQVTGSSSVEVTNTASVSVVNFPVVQSVTLSGTTTIFDVATNSTGISTGLIGTDNKVTLYNSTASVTSSKTNPVYVYSEYDKPVYVANNSSTPFFISSSNTQPIIVDQKHVSGSSKARYSVGTHFDWTSADSGTYVVATENFNRKGLTIYNPTAFDLYVAIGDGGINGFTLTSTASAPEVYSIVVGSSGTYFANEFSSPLFHACYFVSSSEAGTAHILTTEVGL
jgi:hypothetical protein